MPTREKSRTKSILVPTFYLRGGPPNPVQLHDDTHRVHASRPRRPCHVVVVGHDIAQRLAEELGAERGYVIRRPIPRRKWSARARSRERVLGIMDAFALKPDAGTHTSTRPKTRKASVRKRARVSLHTSYNAVRARYVHWGLSCTCTLFKYAHALRFQRVYARRSG